MSRLNAERVNEIFMNCLFKEGEDTTNHIKAEGIVHNVGFNPQRIEEHKQEIAGMLDDLHPTFMQSSGGWSFLQACQDKDGHQWTGLHQRMEQLFQLGLAIKKVECLMPREAWAALPGGMPYYVVKEGIPNA